MDCFKNKLIVFEGQDLSGKTTVAKLLKDYLVNNGIDVVYTYQPGDPNYGLHSQILRSLCIDDRWGLHELSSMFMFFVDRIENINKIVLPSIKAGKTVISDRWWYSTYAYQLKASNIEEKYDIFEELFIYLNKVISPIEPDFVFYFKDKIANSKRDQNKNDSFENKEKSFFDSVVNAYSFLSKKYNFIEIPSFDSPEKTLQFLLSITNV